jgi:hypothetical protein
MCQPSAEVGTSGKGLIRVFVATAMTRSLAELNCPATVEYAANTDVTCSPNSALNLIAGAPPGYETKVISTFAARLSFSNAIWSELPGPTLANVKAPGWASAAVQ